MNLLHLFVRHSSADWARLGRWAHTATGWVLSRTWATRVLIAATAVLAVSAAGAVAYAADEEPTSSSPFLDAFNVKDTHGFSASQYDLNMDNGSKLNFASQYAGAMLVMWWDVYRVGVSLLIWLFNWALGFKILDLLIPPAQAVANTLQRIIDLPGPVGPVAVMLTVAVVPIAYWIQSGKASAGLVELLISLTAAALIGSALASPIDRIAGQSGLIMQARDIGVSLSTEIVTAGRATGPDREQLEANSGAVLADVFIRTPHQLVNYGAVVGDDPKCIKVYDDVIKNAPYDADSDKPREAMGECDPKYMAAAKDPITGFVSMSFLNVAGVVLAAVVAVFVLGLTWLAAQMLLSAATLVFHLFKAILPGTSREGVATAVAVFAVGAGMIIALLGAVGVFTLVVASVFSEASPYSPVVAFIVLDLLLVMGVVYLVTALIRAKKANKKLGERWAKKLSPAPSAVASGNKPAPMRAIAQQAVSYASTKAALGQRPLPSNASGSPTTPAGAGAPTPKAGTARHAADAAGKGTVKAAKLGLAATVGAPVAYPRAAAAAKTALAASRSRVQGRLADAKSAAASAAASKGSAVSAYGREYVHNVAAAGKFAGKVSGATKLAGVAVSLGAGPIAAGVVAGAALAMQTAPTTPTSGRPPARHSSPTPGARPAGEPTTKIPAQAAAPATQAGPASVPAVEVSDHEVFRQRLLAAARDRRAAARSVTPR